VQREKRSDREINVYTYISLYLDGVGDQIPGKHEGTAKVRLGELGRRGQDQVEKVAGARQELHGVQNEVLNVLLKAAKGAVVSNEVTPGHLSDGRVWEITPDQTVQQMACKE
jgi:hypothetical protein